MMGIELYWDDADRRDTFLVEIEGRWTYDELWDTLRKIKKVTDSSPVTLGAILDLSRGTTVPGGTIFTPTALHHARELLKFGQGGTGPIVIVGANGFMKSVFRTFSGLDKNGLMQVKFADTLDEARRMIDAALPHPA
jgi:hypothetical protein